MEAHMGTRGVAIFFATFLTLNSAILGADDVPPKTPWKKPARPTLPTGTPAQQIETLIRQHDALWDAYQKRMEACDNNVEEMILNKQAPSSEHYTELIFKIVQDHPAEP